MKDKYELKKQPVQERSKFTVEVIKEAAAHILRDLGYEKFTTNRVAERAGVSIGSLYQYFPSKEVLIAEIKRDHFRDLRNIFEQAYKINQKGSLLIVTQAMIQASIDAHKLDPPLHRALSGDISRFEVKEDDESDGSIRRMVEQLLKNHVTELRDGINIPLAAEIIYKVIENVIHDTVMNTPDALAELPIASELAQMVVAYLTVQSLPVSQD